MENKNYKIREKLIVDSIDKLQKSFEMVLSCATNEGIAFTQVDLNAEVNANRDGFLVQFSSQNGNASL